MSPVPPRYSVEFARSVPSYSPEPLVGERRLELNPPVARRPIPTGTFTRESKQISLLLTQQEDGAASPTYGRKSSIRGVVLLKNTEDILTVILKVDGLLDLMVAEGWTSYTSIVAQTLTVWQNDPLNQTTCPDALQFEYTLPSSYKDGERFRPLPPSFNYCSPGVPGLCAKCTYTFSVHITKSRFWKRRINLAVPLNYYPRTRPHRPILPINLSFMSTIKPAPKEWHQVTCTMTTRPNTGFHPIECHLFIPSAQIFAITDIIPFHVQLWAPLSSLEALMISPPSTDRRHSPNLFSPATNTRFIRVFLLRQIIVSVFGQRAWRTCVIGEGKLRSLPPLSPDVNSQSEGFQTVSWDGEVRCDDGVQAGGFNVGNLTVKDFIVLALYPPSPTTSPLSELQHAHPIRLVTDPWTVMPDPHEERS